MTHAWLFTGPPGSGRSTAARAFAAALQCVSPDRALGGVPGCGFCDGCHTSLVGTHADVRDRPHRPALHRRQGDPRPGPPRPAVAGRRPLAGHRPGGRRPPHRGRGQRPAEGRRGARAPHGVAAVRARPSRTCCPRSAPAAVYLTLRTPPVDAVADILIRRDGIEPDVAARRRPRHPGPHRPGPPPGHRRAGPGSAAPPCSSCRCASTTSAAASRRPRS